MTKRDKAKNAAQIAKGKAKEIAGTRLDDDQMRVEGEIDQVTGNLKQAGEKVKDALKH